jgi:hypothetical protein
MAKVPQNRRVLNVIRKRAADVTAAMPRYTAIIDTPYGEIGPAAIQAADPGEAIASARSLAVHLLRGVVGTGPDAPGWHLRLCDEEGDTVCTLLLAGHGGDIDEVRELGIR